jgi:hypothetical protein
MSKLRRRVAKLVPAATADTGSARQIGVIPGRA